MVASCPREAASSRSAFAPRRCDKRRRTPALVRCKSRSAATCGACASDTDSSMTREIADSVVPDDASGNAEASRSIGKHAAPHSSKRRCFRCQWSHARRSACATRSVSEAAAAATAAALAARAGCTRLGPRPPERRGCGLCPCPELAAAMISRDQQNGRVLHRNVWVMRRPGDDVQLRHTFHSLSTHSHSRAR